MKLTFIGHDDRSAIEQLQMSLFPQYIHQDIGEAVSKLSRGDGWLTATTTIEINGKKTNRYRTIAEVLNEEKWDYITFQQASWLSGDEKTYIPYFDELYHFVKERSDATLLIHETWAYEEGSDTLASTEMAFFEMQQKLSAGYRRAADANHTLLAPVGHVFAASRKTVQLYDAGDHYHPSQAGSRLAAETIAAVIQMDQAR
jgi:hypothetical protein